MVDPALAVAVPWIVQQGVDDPNSFLMATIAFSFFLNSWEGWELIQDVNKWNSIVHNCTYTLIMGSIVSMGLGVIFLRYMYILECNVWKHHETFQYVLVLHHPDLRNIGLTFSWTQSLISISAESGNLNATKSYILLGLVLGPWLLLGMLLNARADLLFELLDD